MIPRLFLALALLVLAASAQAQEQALPNDPACTRAAESCLKTCKRRHGSDQPGLAGCSARCEADRAQCDVVAGYEKAKPWVQEQIDQIQRFIDGFLGPEVPPPPSRKRENGGGDGERT